MRCSTFAKDDGGAVALMFGLTLFPLIFAVGAAYDYSRATTLRTRLQAATDAATLAVANKVSKKDESKLKQYAQDLITKQTGDSTAKITQFKITTAECVYFDARTNRFRVPQLDSDFTHDAVITRDASKSSRQQYRPTPL